MLLERGDIDLRKFILSKDFIALMKSKIFMQLNQLIVPRAVADPHPKIYKFWVECMGNNHNLVKNVIKRRHWIIWQDVALEGSWLQ